MKRFISVLLAITFIFAFGVGASARLVGDVDSSGKTNSTDALLILQYTVGKTNESMNVDYADVNGDEKINSTDALVVLKIAVGNYDGDLEVEDTLVTNYKAEIVDPVMATGIYTLTTEVEVDDTVSTAAIMVKGNDLCIDTYSQGATIRMLVLSGKTYLVIPMDLPFYKGVYGEIDQELNMNVGTPAKVTYLKSEYVTVDGVEYICESYQREDGGVTDYYFKDGKWAMMGSTSDGETQIQKIVDFKKGVDESSFSLSGYKEVDMSSLMNSQQ